MCLALSGTYAALVAACAVPVALREGWRCGLAFLVRYRASTVAPMVAFPIACPRGECDGVSEVAYPASATEVTVEPST